MTDQRSTRRPRWWPPACGAEGCIGVCVEGMSRCLTHVDDKARKAFLDALYPGAPLDLRGTPVDDELLRSILGPMQEGDGYPRLGRASFQGAQFTGPAVFERAWFAETAWFNGAQFNGNAEFGWVQFTDNAVFDEAQFAGGARFHDAQFIRRAIFEGVQFSGPAVFESAQFTMDAWFRGTQFNGPADFYRAQFSGNADFQGAQFHEDGSLGPLMTNRLMLDRTSFQGAMFILAVSPVVTCIAARFNEAATFRLRFAELMLDDTVFVKPSTVGFAEDMFTYPLATGDHELFDETPLRISRRAPRPRLLSVRGVDTSTLTLTDLDLSPCLFAHAHHLDQLRIEGPRPFADTPRGWRLGRVGGQGLPVWRWTRRQALAEEHHWRARLPLPPAPNGRPHPKLVGWDPPSCRMPEWVEEEMGQRIRTLAPDHLATLYRALRKAQEDSKNEPGAADFYYGEMEMRRKAAATPWGERIILTLYWLVSGYGLRGLRALWWLLAVFMASTLALRQWGFRLHHRPWGSAILYAAGALTHLVSPPDGLLNEAGQAVRISIGFVGPVLLGLALLAVRNRVKR